MSNIIIADLAEARVLDKQAMTKMTGGRSQRGVIGTLDGANRVFITEWQLFTLAMEGKVTYK